MPAARADERTAGLAPYVNVKDAAGVYLRDPELALEQLRSVVEFPGIASFIMSRGGTDESWGSALWQEVVATDGRRVIMWGPTTNTATTAGRWFLWCATILLSTITEHS